MHKNHRRKNKQNYPWDNRGWKVPFPSRLFREEERRIMRRLLQDEDPDELLWPTVLNHAKEANPWFYD